MRSLVFLGCLLLVAIPTGSVAWTWSTEDTVKAEPPQIELGRFQIVLSPNLGRHTFLLDSVTGEVWQLTKFTDVKGEPTVWDKMTKLDNFGQTLDFIKSVGGFKPKTPAP